MFTLKGRFNSFFDFFFSYISLRIFCGIQKLMVLWNSVSRCGLRSVFENIGLSGFMQPNCRSSWTSIVFLPFLTCPTSIFHTFLIATKLCWIDSIILMRSESILIQYLCYHPSNPKAIVLIPHFPDLKFSVTAVAQLIQA